MKLVCISDTHTQHQELDMPAGDALICAGDFTYRGTFFETVQFNTWLGKLDYEHKLVIAGNHELGFEKQGKGITQGLLSNAIYLEGDAHKIEDVTFWGGPWTPRFYDWEFNVDRGELYKYWDQIPRFTQVLITHGPPRGYLDRSMIEGPDGSHLAGCEELLRRIEDPDQMPVLVYHIFGHIHGEYGTVVGAGGTTFVNATMCDENYDITKKPMVLEI
jgi:Icc-related predicted phosphoesterase